MNLTVAYRTRSAIVSGPSGLTVALAPNLRRDRVGFDAELRHPLRFREAIGALHDILISDLRHPARDRSTHEAHLTERKTLEDAIRPATPARPLRRAARPARRRFRQEASAILDGPRPVLSPPDDPRPGTLASPDAV